MGPTDERLQPLCLVCPSSEPYRTELYHAVTVHPAIDHVKNCTFWSRNGAWRAPTNTTRRARRATPWTGEKPLPRWRDTVASSTPTTLHRPLHDMASAK